VRLPARRNDQLMRTPKVLDRRILAWVVWTTTTLALNFAGQRLQSGVHLNHDVAYFVHFDKWLPQGPSFGADLFDGNLRMVWMLFMPPAAFELVLVAALAPQMGLLEAVDCALPR